MKHLFVSLLAIFLFSSCSPITQPASEQQILRIHDLQGCSHVSPFVNKRVSKISGIVTYKIRNGFYLQDNFVDDKACSSEAIFVFTENYPSVIPGDLVEVSGIVKEFYPGVIEDQNLSITEISQPVVRKISSNHDLPPVQKIPDQVEKLPTTIIDNDGLQKFDIFEDGIDYFESMESMLVEIEGGYVVGPRNSYNEIVIIPDGLEEQNLISANGALLQTEQDLNPERIFLNLSDINTDRVNTGDYLIIPITGVVDYSYGNYKITVFGKASFSHATVLNNNSLQGEYDLRIATFNVENLSRLDSDNRFNKLARQLIIDLNAPEIVVLNEVLDDSGIEDDGVVSPEKTMQRLIDSLDSAGGIEYEYVQINPVNNQDGGVAGGNIRSVIIYRSDAGLELDISNEVINENPVVIGANSSAFNGSRKPLVALFKKGDIKLMVIGVHFTSRGADSPLFGSQQPVNQPELSQRFSQADYVSGFVEAMIKKHPDLNIFVAGDLNDMPWSKTVLTLMGKNLIDPGNILLETERFSYIFEGNAIQLDYIFTNATAASKVNEYKIFHLNSIFDQTLRVSDHDPVVIGIDLE